MGRPKGLQAARRHKVGILWLKGFSVRDIADLIRKDKELVGADRTSYVTVHNDIQAIKSTLLERQLEEILLEKNRSIDHLRLVQQRAWTEVGKVSADKRAPLLNIIQAAEDKIAKLEGTYAPTEITGKGGKPLIPKSPLIFQLPDGGIWNPPALPSGDGDGHKDEELADL